MIQLIRGFKDILPGEAELWQEIEKISRSLFEDFGFKEIRVPIMEKTELFARSIGENTDIVEKEMYTFPDRKGDLITLRPEATASIVRSYIQHKMYAQDPVKKFYTIGPMFRRERPQKGRYRQFYQINAEVLGLESPYIDAQLIYMLITLFKRLSVNDITAHINSLGCPKCRPDFRSALSKLLNTRIDDLCEDCRRRSDKNPLRVLDCKVPKCRETMTDAPSLLDYLCPECSSHFETVKTSLEKLGILFVVDKSLVRGLDYYTRTTFEILTGSLGAQSAVAGGGRYDGLIKTLDGPDLPAIGFAIGFDRLAEITSLKNSDFEQKPEVFIAALGDQCQDKAFEWCCILGTQGIKAEMDMEEKSLKSQMKKANRLGAGHVLIFGQDELESGKALLRNMATKEQTEISVEKIPDQVKAILKNPSK
ncbi:Histidine--tRNA ligase [Desulfonema limicola]|uniref:Histidine--tRNA ligase n=1 Tax=Desulfonema limicola TaxID=45656 RepID=A0A975B3G4_9BACT|nr:histidine--tRNA ligase [Desulfonema limicola]QTA78094.1 Histidine--tRNA ligase [Desulfonema limicola]